MNDRSVRTRFDALYYERFYKNPATRAATPQETKRRGAFIAAYLRHLDLPVTRILDLGCGLGHLLKAVGEAYPRARRVGVEWSEYLCERHGWQKGSVVDFDSAVPFDLVMCNDVVQYLDDGDASAALANLARLTRGALYFGVLTKEDWVHVADCKRTDDAVYLRSTRWYRRRLVREFTTMGGGLYLKKPEAVTLWSLDGLR